MLNQSNVNNTIYVTDIESKVIFWITDRYIRFIDINFKYYIDITRNSYFLHFTHPKKRTSV